MNELRKKEYDKAYMGCALSIAQLSYARRSKVGCIIVSKEGQIISQGFNGTPTGMDNCCENVECLSKYRYGCAKCDKPIKEVKNVSYCVGCNYAKLITKPEVLHAESNAIAKCAKWLNTTDGGTIYVTLSPCQECSKLIIQSGIKKVFYHEAYRDTSGIEFLKNNGIEVEKI